jgi:diguanylate cyclase (GGDEF)-like protein/PAS domain S-box-containing protein
MPRQATRKTDLAAEVDELRRRLANLQGIEQRCKHAEAALKALEERNRLLGDSTPLGIFTIDAKGRITGINRKMKAMFSRLSVNAMKSMNLMQCRELLQSGLSSDMRRCMDQMETVVVERAYNDAQDGRLLWRHYLSPIPEKKGAANGMMAIVEDFTDLNSAQEALRESENRYRQLFQSAPVALIEWDASDLKAHLEELRVSGIADFRVYFGQHPQQVHHCWSLIKAVEHNQAFLDLMGVVDGAGPTGAFIPTDAPHFLRLAREIILLVAAGDTAVEREETLVTATGEPKIVLGKSLVISGHEDTLARVAIALVDISERKKAEAALQESERRFREQALRDGLTGLYNQRYLYQSLATLIERASAADTPISLIFMDLDHFKQVVDTHGHLNGSRVIQQVARTINNGLKTPAYAVAYAGDEFVVVLPGWDPQSALQKAAEIRSDVKRTRFVLDRGVEVRLTASFGLATYPQDAASLNGLIAAADQALFIVKEAGKDTVGRFQEQ